MINRIIIKNFFYLLLIRGSNYILPLITFPYLVKVLGISGFGLLSFILAVIFYFSVIIDYGFNLSITRDISKNVDNQIKINRIFTSVYIIKLFLFIVGLVLLSVFLYLIDNINTHLYLLAYLSLIGNVLFPTWFFQGIEKMKFITYIYIFTKLLYVVGVFVFINSSNDMKYVIMILSATSILSGLLGLFFAKYNHNINFDFKDLELLKYIKEGFHIFISSISGNLYGQGTIVILGLTTNPEVVGMYSIAEKLMKAISGIFIPFSQAIFPYINKLLTQNINEFRKFYHKSFNYFILVNLITVLISFFLAKYIFLYIFNIDNEEIIKMFQLLIFVGFFTTMGIYLSPFALALNQDKLLSKLYLIVGINFLWIAYMFSNLWSAFGIAIALLFVELTISVFLYILIKRKLNYV
jgi:PST family polysaccharide transporter